MFFGVYDLVEWLYFLIPLAAVTFFIVSMVRWLQAKDAPPGTFSPEQLRTRKILFRLSAVVVGVLAAVMYAGSGAKIGPSFMTTIQVNAFLAGILGGFSTFHGPVIGAICIPLATNCVGFLANVPGMSGITRWSNVIVYVLMLIVILIKPQGLVGKKIVKKV